MKIGFLITVRLKSTRLPKKVLLPLNGFTVIDRVIQRAKMVVEPKKVVLCTSTLHQDLPLVDTAVRNNIYYFNGHPDDVLKRLLDASDLFGFDFFIGITADNPLFSIQHANFIKNMFSKDTSLDYVYTTGMPIGINIYGINVKALRTICTVKKQIDTEIWGPLIKRPEIFNVKELKVEQEYRKNDYRLTLDEQDDYKVINAVYNNFVSDKVIDVLEAYDFLNNNPKIARVNNHVIQKELDKSTLSKIESFFKKNRHQILKIRLGIYKNQFNNGSNNF